MTDDAVLEQLIEPVRAINRAGEGGVTSNMAPFSGEETRGFGAVLQSKYYKPPPYAPDTRDLDKFLMEFVLTEPHLKGVLGQVVSLIRNRGYSLTGGRNQVLRVSSILQNANRREGARYGDGWRHFIGLMAQNYYISCFGAIAEVGRVSPPEVGEFDVTTPAMAGLWSGDPTRFKMRNRGTQDYPLKFYPVAYYPSGGRVAYWTHSDYFRLAPNPDSREEYLGVGYSHVAICRELAEIMIAVYKHDKEMLNAQAPTGLLLLKNIDQSTWNQAMAARDAQLSLKEREYYGGVSVLAQYGVDEVDAKLLALSQLPAGFDKKQMIDLLMYLYALVFKFPPDEFWPVSSSGFQRTAEVSIGSERATSKGEFEFLHEFQAQLQQELPATVNLTFEERDNRGRQLAASVALTWAQVVEKLKVAEIVTAEQAMAILAEERLVPVEWTDIVEDSVVDDQGQARMRRLRDEAMETAQVQRAVAVYSRLEPNMPIVQYQWPTGRMVTLWSSAAEAAQPHVWLTRSTVTRATLYKGDDFRITDADVGRAIEEARKQDDLYAELLENKPMEEEEMKK